MSGRALGLLPALLLAAVATAAGAESVASPEADPSRGRLLFRIHCASCHGAEGRGDGPLARDLTVRPADLTRIARRHDGSFPAAEVRSEIAGTEPIAGHGTREMPVWGLGFGRGPEDPRPEETAAALDDLVAWLRTIQDGPGSAD